MFPFDLEGFGHLLILGTAITLAITACAALLGSLVGLVMASAKISRYWILRKIADTYTGLVRGMPDLLIIFLVYYGGSATVSAIMGHPIEVNAFAAGTLALGFVFGAYATEIFRGAIAEVPTGQREAAHALGLSSFKTFTYVIFPQAWRLTAPAFGNQLSVLLKETSLVSLVGLEDLMRRTSFAVEATNKPFLFYCTAALLYFILNYGLDLLVRVSSRKNRLSAVK